VLERQAFLSPPVRRTASGPSSGALTRFTDIAGGLERASRAIARLDALLTGHPLEPAWLWRIRLEAVRRQAAIDGRVIDPWHLAAVIEGVRFRMDRVVAIIDRGAIFEAARHALGLWRWFARPDEAQTESIGCAAAALPATQQASPLLGAALGVRAWLDRDGEHPPLRAALALYWQQRGLLHFACPLLTGAKALASETPREIEAWTVRFLAALAEKAEAGTEYLRLLEREWFAARSAVQDRRRDSRAVGCGRHHGGLTRCLRYLARRRPRHRGQERLGTARGVRRARHRDRGDASLEAPALRVERPRTAARGSSTTPPPDPRA
jgi:hypothetical protein